MTLEELKFLLRVIHGRHSFMSEYQKEVGEAIKIVEREIKLKVMDPRKE